MFFHGKSQTRIHNSFHYNFSTDRTTLFFEPGILLSVSDLLASARVEKLGDLNITSASTERQKRSQNLAPVLVINSGNSLVFSRKIITSTGFYRCSPPRRVSTSSGKNQSLGFGKRGLLEKGSFQKSPFSRDSREFRASRDFRESPDFGQ